MKNIKSTVYGFGYIIAAFFFALLYVLSIYYKIIKELFKYCKKAISFKKKKAMEATLHEDYISWGDVRH